MTDELHEPLGRDRPPPARHAAARARGRNYAAGAALALVALGAVGLALAPRDPFGGEPHAVARIESAKPPEPGLSPPSVAAGEPAAAPSGREQLASVTDIEQLSGVKVTRSGAEASNAHIIRVEPSSGVRLTLAPDRRVVEKGRYGALPKIGADGARPMDVYSRPFVAAPSLKADAPRIALVIGGVGLNAQASGAAIEQTPEAVTLAFAPYGADVDRLVAYARERGHETLLQAPMEPFDYPQNNPGPHTLLTGGRDGADLDDLHWLLSRFSGYAGVMNFLGARFTADEKALTPALADIGARGLYFLDDGTSPQSLVTTLAPNLSLPYGKVDVVIDARETPQSIEAALTQLEATARQKGVAIGFANAQPGTIARLARFARELERRGIALAPVSAALGPKGVSAGVSAEAASGARQ